MGEKIKSSSIFSNVQGVHDFHPDVGLIVYHIPNSYFELITNDGETKTRLPAIPDLPEDPSYLWKPCMVIVNPTTIFFAGENSAHKRLTNSRPLTIHVICRVALRSGG